MGFLYVEDLVPDPALLVPKRWDVGTTRAGLAAALTEIVDAGDAGFTKEALEPALRSLADARGWKAGDLFMAIRVAISGRTATPPLFESMVALGRETTLARLDRAAGVLAAAPAGSTPPA